LSSNSFAAPDHSLVTVLDHPGEDNSQQEHDPRDKHPYFKRTVPAQFDLPHSTSGSAMDPLRLPRAGQSGVREPIAHLA
jgi:hypothetical protein